jgi:hypothetical protein
MFGGVGLTPREVAAERARTDAMRTAYPSYYMNQMNNTSRAAAWSRGYTGQENTGQPRIRSSTFSYDHQDNGLDPDSSFVWGLAGALGRGANEEQRAMNGALRAALTRRMMGGDAPPGAASSGAVRYPINYFPSGSQPGSMGADGNDRAGKYGYYKAALTDLRGYLSAQGQHMARATSSVSRSPNSGAVELALKLVDLGETPSTPAFAKTAVDLIALFRKDAVTPTDASLVASQLSSLLSTIDANIKASRNGTATPLQGSTDPTKTWKSIGRLVARVLMMAQTATLLANAPASERVAAFESNIRRFVSEDPSFAQQLASAVPPPTTSAPPAAADNVQPPADNPPPLPPPGAPGQPPGAGGPGVPPLTPDTRGPRDGAPVATPPPPLPADAAPTLTPGQAGDAARDAIDHLEEVQPQNGTADAPTGAQPPPPAASPSSGAPVHDPAGAPARDTPNTNQGQLTNDETLNRITEDAAQQPHPDSPRTQDGNEEGHGRRTGRGMSAVAEQAERGSAGYRMPGQIADATRLARDILSRLSPLLGEFEMGGADAVESATSAFEPILADMAELNDTVEAFGGAYLPVMDDNTLQAVCETCEGLYTIYGKLRAVFESIVGHALRHNIDTKVSAFASSVREQCLRAQVILGRKLQGIQSKGPAQRTAMQNKTTVNAFQDAMHRLNVTAPSLSDLQSTTNLGMSAKVYAGNPAELEEWEASDAMNARRSADVSPLVSRFSAPATIVSPLAAAVHAAAARATSKLGAKIASIAAPLVAKRIADEQRNVAFEPPSVLDRVKQRTKGLRSGVQGSASLPNTETPSDAASRSLYDRNKLNEEYKKRAIAQFSHKSDLKTNNNTAIVHPVAREYVGEARDQDDRIYSAGVAPARRTYHFLRPEQLTNTQVTIATPVAPILPPAAPAPREAARPAVQASVPAANAASGTDLIHAVQPPTAPAATAVLNSAANPTIARQQQENVVGSVQAAAANPSTAPVGAPSQGAAVGNTLQQLLANHWIRDPAEMAAAQEDHELLTGEEQLAQFPGIQRLRQLFGPQSTANQVQTAERILEDASVANAASANQVAHDVLTESAAAQEAETARIVAEAANAIAASQAARQLATDAEFVDVNAYMPESEAAAAVRTIIPAIPTPQAKQPAAARPAVIVPTLPVSASTATTADNEISDMHSARSEQNAQAITDVPSTATAPSTSALVTAARPTPHTAVIAPAIGSAATVVGSALDTIQNAIRKVSSYSATVARPVAAQLLTIVRSEIDALVAQGVNTAALTGEQTAALTNRVMARVGEVLPGLAANTARGFVTLLINTALATSGIAFPVFSTALSTLGQAGIIAASSAASAAAAGANQIITAAPGAAAALYNQAASAISSFMSAMASSTAIAERAVRTDQLRPEQRALWNTIEAFLNAERFPFDNQGFRNMAYDAVYRADEATIQYVMMNLQAFFQKLREMGAQMQPGQRMQLEDLSGRQPSITTITEGRRRRAASPTPALTNAAANPGAGVPPYTEEQIISDLIQATNGRWGPVMQRKVTDILRTARARGITDATLLSALREIAKRRGYPEGHDLYPEGKDYHQTGFESDVKKVFGKGSGFPKQWIQRAEQHIKHGAFTAQAHNAGYPTAGAYAAEVLAHPSEHTMRTRKRAQFLGNIGVAHPAKRGRGAVENSAAMLLPPLSRLEINHIIADNGVELLQLLQTLGMPPSAVGLPPRQLSNEIVQRMGVVAAPL